ncbi:5-methylaminomethyl-2-thiouridylate-methyltransferase [Epithele typhae]|uniref:5-methylaminomethyl-2-thiouridylate- methyltransferase n=1 Tax=Epithele typhae TaxID=378194 RepID=UPI0020076C6F|nr:5-methylaminomethyl-2-thiouridylate-methyltransferase [Epithele typhae]KAH9931704.1 5-methylaminomethyl-2-thiouridylate-methyltransferase [Epithele typhae]
MSGGVDSSVTAKLLADQDFDLSAVFMRNWDTRDESGTDDGCEWKKDWEDVRDVCRLLGIRCEMVDLSREYWTRVFEPSLALWEKGFSPNPDVWCNQEVKFGALMDHIKPKDAWIATGHYADKRWALPSPNMANFLAYSKMEPRPQLRRPVDASRDQTYFLTAIPERSLARTLFPLAQYKKGEVREMARKWELPTATRDESRGICFVGKKRRFDSFLSQYLVPKPGPFIHLETGKVLGQHQGLFTHTIGQRARLASQEHAMFVAKKDIQKNALYIVPRSDHPSLKFQTAIVDNWKWIWEDCPPHGLDAEGFRGTIQYQRSSASAATIHRIDDSRMRVTFQEPQPVTGAGQVFAMYSKDWCLGAGSLLETS